MDSSSSSSPVKLNAVEESCWADHLEILTGFLGRADISSSPSSASPVQLWSVLRTLAAVCVSLIEKELTGKASSRRHRGQGDFSSVHEVLGDTAGRVTVLASVVEQMHMQAKESECAFMRAIEELTKKNEAATEALARYKREYSEVVDAKIAAIRCETDEGVEKLKRGVERHALQVNRDLAALQSSVVKLTASRHTDEGLSRRDNVSKKPLLGLALKDWRGEGVEVASVTPSQAAALSGLCVGDVIFALNAAPCRSRVAFHEMISHSEGGQLELHVLRRGVTLCITVSHNH